MGRRGRGATPTRGRGVCEISFIIVSSENPKGLYKHF